MIIKSFTATSSAAALKRVREEMGGDAIVMKTNQHHDRINGTQVEITACIENPTVDQSSRILDSRPDKDISSESIVPVERVISPAVDTAPVESQDTDGQLGVIRKALKEADVTDRSIDSILCQLKETYPDSEEVHRHAMRILSDRLADAMLPELTYEPGDRVLFIGPAGSGKSSALGKLAAHLVARRHTKVKLATLDDMKLGAHEELQTYADFLELGISDLQENSGNDSVTLVDGPALYLAEDSIRNLKSKVELINPDYCFLVFSSLMRSREIERYAKRAVTIGATHLIMTNLDQTNSLGGSLAAADSSGLKIAFITDSPGGVGMISCPDPHRTAVEILGAEVSHE